MAFKIVTWNINSIRLRQNLVARYLLEMRPDVLCLQEIKCQTQDFPYDTFRNLGYTHISVHGQKGYNGVAILSRIPFTAEETAFFYDKQDARHVGVILNPELPNLSKLHIHNFYVPAGGDIADTALNPKFAHKLSFVEEMIAYTQQKRIAKEPTILVGDFNIAPLEHDVWNHRALLDVVSHTPVEVDLLNKLQKSGDWGDVPRFYVPEKEKLYSWWSYRSPNWEKANKGRRLDHIWASPDMKSMTKGFSIEKNARGWERPSDHAPVMVEIG